MRAAALLVVVLLAGFSAPTIGAQELARAEIAKRAKLATALVQAAGLREGSAFCIHESGLFLTNEHVVGDVQEVTLVLNPGLANQEVLTAKVIRKDSVLDLALLNVEKRVRCPPLALGSSDVLAEQSEVIAAGFPFGKGLALEQGEYPSVSVNSGKISSLRLKNGELERIQTDAVLNPGNSGGPLLDTKGEVIGMVTSGVRGATISFAIPATQLHRFVDIPEVDVQISTVAYADRFKAVAFQVKVLAPLPSKEPYQVELILGARDGTVRSFPMKLNEDVYRAVAEPLHPPMEPRMLKATFSYPTGNLHGLVSDLAFRVGGKEIKLGDVRSVHFGGESTVVMVDGKTLKGSLRGLEELLVHLGSDTVKLNPAKALDLVLPSRDPDKGVEYTVVVRQGAKELARVREVLAFRDGPAAPSAASTVSTDPQKEAKRLDGFWVLVQSESKGKLTWPQHPEEAIYIEGNKVLWVTKNGKIPPNGPEADIEVDVAKNPRQLILSIRRGPAHGQKWLAIYAIDANMLTIATNCDEDRCPSLFTIRATAGGAQFVRTYRRVTD